MNIIVSSLKFSPGHLSHALAFAKLFKKLDHNVLLFLHEEYKFLVKNSEFPVIWFPKEKPEKVDIVFLINPSIHNYAISKQYKKDNAKIIYLYHEPWESLKKYIKEGLKQTIKTIIAHSFSVKVLSIADLIIVPSDYALQLYNLSDIKYNKKVIKIPLLFYDENSEKIDVQKKQFFSYIGHAVKGHAFDKYIDVIKYIYKKNIKINFEISTRTNLDKLINKDKTLKEMIKKNILKINHGKPLTNDEINNAYKRSFCVWNVYRRSTQSGVLPKAFMFGTPVIASNIGSFPEYVKNDYNGFIVENFNYNEILEKILTIKYSINDFSKNCRTTFFDTFYYESYTSLMNKIILELTKL